jgi:pilus assembly protein CpaF
MELVTNLHEKRSDVHDKKNEKKMDPAIVFGPLAEFMADPTIEEIWINSPERIFVARNGKSELSNLVLNSEAVRQLIDRTLLWSGRRLDLSHPFVDARLPDGSRLHVAIPEITAEHWAVNIRKHLMKHLSLNDLVTKDALTDEIAADLKAAVKSGSNILVSGATQAGKTTVLNALASAIPKSERLITIEEVFELTPAVPDLIQLQTRSMNLQGDGEITLRRLIKEALRMRPSRIIIGEVREAEALDLLIALNSGLPGMGTIHANSSRDAIMKLQTLPLLAGENISHKFVAPIVASAIDIVVHVALASNGKRRVTEVSRVTGRFENDRAETELIWSWNGTSYTRGLGQVL